MLRRRSTLGVGLSSALGLGKHLLVWLLFAGLGYNGEPRDGLWVGIVRRRHAISLYFLLRIGLFLLVLSLVTFVLERPLAAAGLLAALVGVASFLFASRALARARLLEAAIKPLAARQPVASRPRATSILPARAIDALAVAVDRMRRGDFEAGHVALREADTGQLLLDEVRLLEGLEALWSASTGDRAGAARRALRGFPTGVPDIDASLAELLAANAWHDGMRLSHLREAWLESGLVPEADSEVGTILSLMDCKLGHKSPRMLADAEVLAPMAEKLGDRQLAEQLRSARTLGEGYR